jgi:hypothetical protein
MASTTTNAFAPLDGKAEIAKSTPMIALIPLARTMLSATMALLHTDANAPKDSQDLIAPSTLMIALELLANTVVCASMESEHTPVNALLDSTESIARTTSTSAYQKCLPLLQKLSLNSRAAGRTCQSVT